MFRFAALVLLFALDSPSGTLLWEARPGGRDFGGLAESANTLTVGNITSQGGIFAFNADTGKLLWSHRGEQMRARTLSDGLHVFALFDGDKGRHLAAYDLKTGKPLWSNPIEDHRCAQDPAPVLGAGRIYVLDHVGHLDAYNTTTGALVFRFVYAAETPDCPSGLTLANNRLYFSGGTHDGSHSPGKFLWAIDAVSGKELWKYQSHFVADYISDTLSTPAVAGDTVVTTLSNHVLALRASTGTKLWTGKAEGVSGGYPKPYPLSAPTIVNGSVLAARSEAIESWALADGRPQTAIPVHFCTDTDLTRLYSDGNTLFFLADHPSDTNKSGRCPLHAMDTTTGKILWTHLVNRQAQFLDNWTTDELLVTPTAVYYTNNSLIAKASR